MDITETIRYIGVNDRDIDLFESQYRVMQGISYNSYLILDESVVVMDTVDSRFGDEWMAKLRECAKGRSVDYLVVSHVEPDHSGSIMRLLESYPDMKVVGNSKTFAMLEQFFRCELNERKVEVKEGDTLSTGVHTLKFYTAPMVHWPEVMVTYEMTEGILFSADGFGTFGAIDDERGSVNGSIACGWPDEAARYYFNIVGKYGAPVQALLKKASALDIRCICSLHGPVLREKLSYYIDLYRTWSSYVPEKHGVLVAYASIHGNTAAAARKFAEFLRESGETDVTVTDLARDDMSEAVSSAFRYDRLCLAAASYDAGVFPCMQDFLNHLQAKAYQKRKVAIIENGSWAPTAARTMCSMLEGMKDIEVLQPVITIKSSMSEENRIMMKELAAKL